MIYLSEFVFPSYDEEYRARLDEKRTCFNTMYPFFVLSSRGLERLDFAPVTLLYGGNGSGVRLLWVTMLSSPVRAYSSRRRTVVERCIKNTLVTVPCSYLIL